YISIHTTDVVIMEILVIPLAVILTPFLMMFLILRYLNKAKGVTWLLKISLGLLFMAIGIMATIFAIQMSINGLLEKGVKCMTGIVVFIPIGIASIVGIPLLLIFTKAVQKQSPVNGSCTRCNRLTS
ncbi:MAG TPA: hypothetical protein VF008_20880, partial [Niastella sp.]